MWTARTGWIPHHAFGIRRWDKCLAVFAYISPRSWAYYLLCLLLYSHCLTTRAWHTAGVQLIWVEAVNACVPRAMAGCTL